MNFFRHTLILALCICMLNVNAQNDSLHHLKVVEIKATRSVYFSSASKFQLIDSATLERYSNNNLADLLSHESIVFIKSYGLGSLASSSFRGAGSSHTAVLWNGFNLQSSMHGMIDLSLIPANFLNTVQLQFGSASALWGSGAVGGAIHLNNSNTFNKGISVYSNTSFGSFLDKQQQLSFEFSKKRIVSTLKVFNHDAKNDFEFTNRAQNGKPMQRQRNAELKQYGLLQENYIQINQFQLLNTRFWYQYSERQMPPSMTQNLNVAIQNDESSRFTTEWQLNKNKYSVNVRAAYFDEKLYYEDSLSALFSKSHSQNAIVELETKFSITKYDMINIGVNNTNNTAYTESYNNRYNQNRSSVFASYRLHTLNLKWNALLNIRQEFINNIALPFTSSFGIDGNVFKYFFLKLNVAQHYRIPTFNDLYWVPGGNPNLLPESGWSEDATISYKQVLKKVQVELEAAAFNREIKNWVIWQPDISGIWSPQNVQEVWSRGLEYKLKVDYRTSKWEIQLSGLYNYVLSTNQKSLSQNDVTLYKQLIYVPIQNSQGNFLIQYKGTSISYNHIYVGYRYTSSDNKNYIKPYSVGNVRLSHDVVLTGAKINVYAQFNNIFNEQYEIIEYRAMPLLNYQLGLAIYFNEKNK